MCGIAGYTLPDGVSELNLERMARVLSHRGPDGSGIFINPQRTVGFGHRRLSIIDLEGGHQPMSNEDGSVWITFNGEIYNFQDLKSSLDHQHVFKTKSDTEVIVHLYEEKGEDFARFLRGMFALAIYDEKTEKLILARDHLGQKPLYFYHEGEEFGFASEIKALLELKPHLRKLDVDALYEYLTLRIITPPRSMFLGVRKLAPGHYLTFRKDRVAIYPYWTLSYEPKWMGNEKEILHDLEEHLESTVRYHLVSDVPVGAFLSGGIDSSLVVAMMHKSGSDRIETFSGDIPYAGSSEITFARLVAERYNTVHHELKINPTLIESLPDVVWHLDEPSDSLAICMYHLASLTREHVKVVLGGDGGDELFGGYDRYYGNLLVSYYALLPERIRKMVIEKALSRVPDAFGFRSITQQLHWMHQMSFYNEGERYAKSLGYFFFSDGFKKLLYTSDFLRRVGAFDPGASIQKYFNSPNATELIDKMLYSDSMLRMPDHPNMILDRMSMAHGLEARAPLLDHRLAEYCAKLPVRLKVRGRQRRYIQMQLAKKYLPPQLLKRKKQGFSSFLTYLLEREIKWLSEKVLMDSRLVSAGYLRQEGIQKLLVDHLDRKRDHGNRLWLLLNAEIWYRMFIEQQDRESMKQCIRPVS